MRLADELNPSILYCKYNIKKHGGGGGDDDMDDALKELLESDSGGSAGLDALKSRMQTMIDVRPFVPTRLLHCEGSAVKYSSAACSGGRG